VEEVLRYKKQLQELQIDKRSLNAKLRNMEEQLSKKDKQYDDMISQSVCLINDGVNLCTCRRPLLDL
jgi:hypothetical protein